MSKTYRPFQPDQLFLMPPSLTDWLPDSHMVYFVRQVLDELDLSPINSVYEDEERGYPPYHPKVMTGILLSRVLPRHHLVTKAGHLLPGRCCLPGVGGE